MYPTVKQDTATNSRFDNFWFDILTRQPDQPKFSHFSKLIDEYSSRVIAINFYLGEHKNDYFIRSPYKTDISELDFTDSAICYTCGESRNDCVSLNVEEGIDSGSYWKYSEERICRGCAIELVELTESLVKEHHDDIAVEVI